MNKAFYQERIKSLQARMQSLIHYRNKFLDQYKTKKALIIQREIDATKHQIQKTVTKAAFAVE